MDSSIDIIEGCSFCDKPSKPHQCQGCQVVFYCSREHLLEHKPVHQEICDRIVRARHEHEQCKLIDEDGRELRHPRQLDMYQRWRFNGDNYKYASTRLLWIEALEELNTREALESVLGHMLETSHLFGNDAGNIMEIICLEFRLGRYAEFYSLAKTHTLESWKEPKGIQGWIATKNDHPDTFESMQWLRSADSNFDIHLMIFLLKFKMLRDMLILKAATHAVGPKVPREILDHILYYLPTTSVVAHNKEVLLSPNISEQIRNFRANILESYSEIHRKKVDILAFVLAGKPLKWHHYRTWCDEDIVTLDPRDTTIDLSIPFWHADPWALEQIAKIREVYPYPHADSPLP